MRVLFSVYPSHAHLWPIVPTAWALQSAGHEVRVATHARFTSSVTAAGLTPVPLGEPDANEPRMRPDAKVPPSAEEVLQYADVLGLDDEGREHWIAYYQYLSCPISDFVRTDLPEAADLVSFARVWQPDLVLWDPTFASGPVAARACGAAHARTLMGPDYFGWSLDRLAERSAELRAAGLPENPHADLVRPLAELYGVDVDHELLYGQWSIDPMPLGMALPTSATRLPMRYAPYTGADVLPEWLYERPQRPRVALSLGESTRRVIKGDWGRTPKILEAVADLDIEVIATLNNLQLEGVEHVPDNVRTADWVNLTHLLPTCTAIIHHGGMGTFGASTSLRVPQIVCDTLESLLLRQVEEEPPPPPCPKCGSVDSSEVVGSGTYRVGWEFGVREEAAEKVTSWVLPAKKLEATPTSNYVMSRGAGTRLNHKAQSVDDIGKMILQVVTEPSFQDGARALHDDWLALPSPAAIVPTLEALTAQHRRR
jgi:UDP:flavonoid glycosyltransferase YjiC (YdhE family)